MNIVKTSFIHLLQNNRHIFEKAQQYLLGFLNLKFKKPRLFFSMYVFLAAGGE
jgi:hypothetical protein